MLKKNLVAKREAFPNTGEKDDPEKLRKKQSRKSDKSRKRKNQIRRNGKKNLSEKRRKRRKNSGELKTQKEKGKTKSNSNKRKKSRKIYIRKREKQRQKNKQRTGKRIRKAKGERRNGKLIKRSKKEKNKDKRIKKVQKVRKTKNKYTFGRKKARQTNFEECLDKFMLLTKMALRISINVEKHVRVIDNIFALAGRKNAKKGGFTGTFDTLLSALGGNKSDPECDGTPITRSNRNKKYKGINLIQST